jgi:hypothetical protein
MIKLISRLYHRTKKGLVIVAIAIPLMLHYLPVPEKLKSESIPLAIVCAFGIAVEMIVSIDKKLDGRTSFKEYSRLVDAIPDVLDILRRGKRGGHVVKLIGSSGGTTVNTLLPEIKNLAREEGHKIDFQILLVDPDSPLRSFMPEHWTNEADVSFQRLEATAGGGLKITCSKYAYLPCLRGILIDNLHLFLGCFAWAEGSALSGATEPHFYLRRSTQNEYVFRVWSSWFDRSPKEPHLPRPAAKPEKAQTA